MKTLKYIATGLLFMLLGSVSLIQAQDTIVNRSVSVEREYRPVIQDAGKINSTPQVLEPTTDKAPAVFSDFNLPLDAGFNIHTLPAAEVITEKPTNKEGYARIGIGSYSNTLIDFAYPLINQPDMRMDFTLNQLGTFESKRTHSTTKAALEFDKIFSTFDLYAGIGGGHEYFKYYGNNLNRADSVVDLNAMTSKYNNPIYTEVNRAGVSTTPRLFNLNKLANDSLDNTFWRFNAHFGVRSLPLTNDLRYMAEMNYNSFNSHNGINEKVVHTAAKFNSPNDDNRMGIDFDMYNMMYNSTAIPAFNFWKNYTVVTLNPYYSIEHPTWNLRIGVRASFSFVHANSINPSPDVRAEWKVAPEYLSLYGGITGNYEVNTLDKISGENPYLFSDLRVKDTNTPYNLYAGIKLKPLYNLMLNAYLDLQQIDNQYFFVNKEYKLVNAPLSMPTADSTLYTNRFNVIYSGAMVTKMGVRANYNLQNFLNVELKWAYNNWSVDTQQYAWNQPKYEGEMNTSVRINPDFSVSANVFYQGDRYAKLGNTAIKMNDKVDVNLGVTYTYLNWFTAFAKINNIINSQYQDYYGYDVQGANVMVGAAFSF
ncbi:MAG: hypothetical protein P4L34_05415 [Paludibacter sp.]|nr:hypothetical protein [Paludibacter sp.]